MKLRDAIFSMAIVGLLVVPVVSFAQGSGNSSTFVNNLFPSLNLASASSTQNSAPSNSGSGILSGLTLSHGDSTKSIRSFDGSGSPVPGGGNSFSVAGTPEPGTWALMIGGFSSGLLALRRRKE